MAIYRRWRGESGYVASNAAVEPYDEAAATVMEAVADGKVDIPKEEVAEAPRRSLWESTNRTAV